MEALGCIWIFYLDTSKSSTYGGKDESKDEDPITLLARHTWILAGALNFVKLDETAIVDSIPRMSIGSNASIIIISDSITRG